MAQPAAVLEQAAGCYPLTAPPVVARLLAPYPSAESEELMAGTPKVALAVLKRLVALKRQAALMTWLRAQPTRTSQS